MVLYLHQAPSICHGHYRAKNVRFQTKNGRYQTKNARFQTKNGRYQTKNARFQTNNVRFQTNNVRFQSRNGRFQTDEAGENAYEAVRMFTQPVGMAMKAPLMAEMVWGKLFGRKSPFFKDYVTLPQTWKPLTNK